MSSTLKELQLWLKKDPEKNTLVKIASSLKYKTDSSIRHWIKKGKIPLKQERNVMEFLKNKK